MFTYRMLGDARPISVELAATFTHEHWETLTAFVRSRMESGFYDWDLDLRRLAFLSSMLMGQIIGFNMVLLQKSGTLRLVVERNSRIAQLIYISKINRILTVMEI